MSGECNWATSKMTGTNIQEECPTNTAHKQLVWPAHAPFDG